MPAPVGGGNQHQGGGDKKEDEDKNSLNDAIKQCIVKSVPTISFKDVAGLDRAKQAL